MIGHVMTLLDHCASLLPFIEEDEDKNERYHVWVACTNSFTTDFRALYYFIFKPQKTSDAHRKDFIPGSWKPNSKSRAAIRLDRLTTFIDKHRAHLSWDRYETKRADLSSWIPADYLNEGRLKAAGYARILTDYLDVLDDFIRNVPNQDEQQRFFGAAFNARYKVNSFMGLPLPSPVLRTP